MRRQGRPDDVRVAAHRLDRRRRAGARCRCRGRSAPPDGGRPGPRRHQRCTRTIARLEQENAAAAAMAAGRAQADRRKPPAARACSRSCRISAVSYVTARVIANSGGGYVRTVMINAGSEAGLARGQAAITGDGLVGRLTEVGSRAARVLLITDLNSRIPVVVEGSRTSAVLAGDNSERPRLLYVGDAGGAQDRRPHRHLGRRRRVPARPAGRHGRARRRQPARGSSRMSSCRSSAMCWSSITACPALCRNRCRSRRATRPRARRPATTPDARRGTLRTMALREFTAPDAAAGQQRRGAAGADR